MDAETRTYLDDMRQEMATMRVEMRQEMATLRGEMRQGDAETRSQLGALIEAQRHDLAAVAEGVVANGVAIDRLGRELRKEMDERFGTVQLAFVRVRRDIARLRSPRRRRPRDS